MDLSIIIVSWKVREKLKENLRAIFESNSGLEFEVFVIDNNSEDGTVEMVKNELNVETHCNASQRNASIRLIENKENFGFARACNQGIKEAKGEFILLLNPDMKVFPDTFLNMVRWMQDNKQASVASCHLIDEKGETIKHVRRFPRFSDQLAIVLKLPHLFPGILKKYIREDFDYSKAQRVDSIRGGFFLIRHETIESVGMLDERFFIWFEEVDYCKQVKNSGSEVWYTPDAKCIDFIGQSFKQVKRGKTQKYFRDSQLKYFQKWHPAWQYQVLKILWPIGIILTNIGEKLSIKNKSNT